MDVIDHASLSQTMPERPRQRQARAGLSVPAVRQSRRYKVKPAALGGVSPGINLDKALALADAIEDQELARKMQLRK
jgi:hypothetical protein